MKIKLLGPLEVSHNGSTLELRQRKPRGLFALMVLNRNREVSTEWLIDQLWAGDAPRSARSALQGYVTVIRRGLGIGQVSSDDHALLTTVTGYRLNVPSDSVDVDRFDEEVDLGRQAIGSGDFPEARLRLASGLGLWRGDALADFRNDEFAQIEIKRLEELRADAEEDLVAAAIADGARCDLVVKAHRLVYDMPFRERRWALLMEAFYRAGRQVEALQAFDRVSEMLRLEMQIEPSSGLQDLASRIRKQDPSLLD